MYCDFACTTAVTHILIKQPLSSYHGLFLRYYIFDLAKTVACAFGETGIEGFHSSPVQGGGKSNQAFFIIPDVGRSGALNRLFSSYDSAVCTLYGGMQKIM